jgi:hypothetical protein
MIQDAIAALIFILALAAVIAIGAGAAMFAEQARVEAGQ